MSYERMERGTDKNWSWIGKAADGMDAIITFGERAVFGQIVGADGKRYGITTEAGRTYVVETDLSKLVVPGQSEGRQVNDAMLPTAEIDALLERKESASRAGGKRLLGAADAAVANTVGNTATVDVLLAYSTGLANHFGGSSQMDTRLNYLMSIANQSLSNGLVSHRVRLVHTMQVNYDDSIDNLVALNGLTGIGTVPSALAAVRSAREQYGADLVSMLRLTTVNRTDCGLGWLTGLNQTPINNINYAGYGYSVANDGVVVDPATGRTLRCYDHSLAHELGHNMGQHHDIDNSEGNTGAHAYSYGYREATVAGFFTVMAYALSQAGQVQSPILHFGNPNVSYAGRPTGSGGANNALSMEQTMPLIAGFRNTIVPPKPVIPNDYNGDARSDILWRYLPADYLAIWHMNGPLLGTYWSTTNGPASYTILNKGDFNGDELADILWVGPSGDLWLWFSTGNDFTGGFIGYVPAGWSVVGVGDVTGDRKSDLIWRYNQTGAIAYWQMNGAATVAGAMIDANAPIGYRLVGIQDMNGDRLADLVWTNDGVRDLWVWTSYLTVTRQLQYNAANLGAYAADRSPVGIGDFDRDARADIFWRFPASGRVDVWRMNGGSVLGQSTVAGAAPGAYGLVGINDYNGDGRADMLWAGAGEIWMWQSTGTDISAARVTDIPAGWSPTL